MKKPLSLLLSIVLCVTAFSFSASAVGETAISTTTPIVASGYTYAANSILTVPSRNNFKAMTRIELKSSSIITDNPFVYYQARLYNNRGTLVLSSSVVQGYGDNFPLAETGEWGYGVVAYSQGWVRAYDFGNDPIEVTLHPTARITLDRPSSTSDDIQAIVEASLDDNCQYPVNQFGESYGSCVLAEIVGEEPDLISAVGEDGVEGFVRAEELCADYDVLPDEVVLIPLYDVSGVEIGSFALNSMKGK